MNGNVRFSFMLLFTALTSGAKATDESVVTLEYRPPIIRVGKPLTLICKVNNIKFIDKQNIRQWHKGTDLIVQNGKIFDKNKYKEIIKKKRFLLRITKVTEADLNTNFKCNYNFKEGNLSLKISPLNFEYPPSNDTKALITQTDESVRIYLHFEKIYPYPQCTGFVHNSNFSCIFKKRDKQDAGKFYTVDLICHSNSLIKCNETDNIKVVCLLIFQYQIQTDRNQTCKPKDNLNINHDNYSRMELALSLVMIGAVMFMIFLVAVRWRNKKIKQVSKNAVYTYVDYDRRQTRLHCKGSVLE
ncbi:uncharacterized protein LOC134693975 [Mytilus trossulus]|uniref:uncharacterized protein LOC134693975 n=1 Tax=Mytilus trossulus TaxID=6551 RepID=UPI0030079A5F